MADDKHRSPTSFDVARLAGVSRSAVSRAYTEGAAVAEETRTKVFAAAATLGYRVNSLARGLQTGHSDIVGLVASRLDTPIRSRQIRLLTEGLLKRGFRPMLITADHAEEVRPRLHVLLGYNVAGVIVTSDSPPPEIVDECTRREIPLVLVNRDPDVPGGDRVQIDPVAGGKMVYRLLRDAGARRFACVTPVSETYSVTGRAAAFARYARAAGHDCLVIHSDGQSHAAGRAAVLAANAGLTLVWRFRARSRWWGSTISNRQLGPPMT
jgi:DNA-binding LacI/PurR family transcriptional regulator